MPGVLYKGFCYPTPEAVGNAIVSDPFAVNGLAVIRSYLLNPTKDTMTINITGINPANASAFNGAFYIYPKSAAMSCPDLQIGNYVDGSAFYSLVKLFENYFDFNMSIFETIITSSLVLFATGIGLRYVVKMMNKTVDY